MDTKDLIAFHKEVETERNTRTAIKNSPEYLALQGQISQLTDDQEAMLLGVPDSSDEYNLEKKAVIAYMISQNIDELGNVRAVFRTKNEVNVARLLNVLEGDIDNLVILTNVKQTDLKAFAKTDQRKKELLACIESGQVLSDISISPVA